MKSILAARARIIASKTRRTGVLFHSKSKSSLAAETASVENESIKPFESIPSPPAWPLLGHIPMMSKPKHVLGMDRFMDSLHAQYGDMIRLNLPGTGNMLILFNPEHFSVLSRNEPRIPNVPIFDLGSFKYCGKQKFKLFR